MSECTERVITKLIVRLGLHGQSLETYELRCKSESWRSTAACATHDEQSQSSVLCQAPVAASKGHLRVGGAKSQCA